MELLNYLLKVSACSMLFFAFYLIVLHKLTFFKFNRFYLLVTLMLSFIIPALQFTIEREVARVATIDHPIAVQAVDLGGQSLNESIIVGNGPTDYEYMPFDWYSLLPYTYIAIVTVLLLLATLRLVQLIKHTKTGGEKINGLKLVTKKSGFTNCSFFNYVFIDEDQLTPIELQILLAHEEVHAKQYHSVDKIIMMIVKAVLWFNPIIYFYDKALEQTHEYEADEATSRGYGTNNYAGLLLRLAVNSQQLPLVHNFVKSPIKARIKMLFNDKSKGMKKLSYLLVIPIGLTLTWGFTVDVVYTTPPQVQGTMQQDSSKFAKNKATNKLRAEAYRKSSEYLIRLQEANDINQQTLKGKIGTDYKGAKSPMNNGKLFTTGNKTYILQAGYGIEGLKSLNETDEVEVKVSAALISQDAPYLIVSAGTIKKNGVLVYVKPPLKKQPFLFEANRARFAWSKIKAIERNANGIINRIVLNDNTYTIKLNVAAQQFKNSTFKAGDKVLVKFFGEKLIDEKTYATDKMIVLYSEPKKYELKNSALYTRFYHADGTQIVPDDKAFNTSSHEIESKATNAVKPRLLSSTSATIDTKSNVVQLTMAKMEIGSVVLTADEMIWDKTAETITAAKATITSANAVVVSGESLFYDLKKNAYKVNKAKGNIGETKNSVYNLVSKLPYQSQDSVRVSKTANTITLYGKAKVNIDHNILTGDKIVINKGSNEITAYHASFTDQDNVSITAKEIKFNAISKKIVADGVDIIKKQ